MSLSEDDLPVLNAVVESGNRSIIQSTRLGNEVLRELESLRVDAARGFPANENQATMDSESDPVQASEVTDESVTLPTAASSPADVPQVEIQQGLDFASLSGNHDSLADDELEIMIDDIVDRHITALRRDIKRLLERARSSP